MSLIPFILELADELHEFNRCLSTGGMDVDDFGFGIYPHELQPQQQQQQSPQQQQQSQHPLQQQQQTQQQHLSQQRRPRTLSQFYWLPNISKSRHHPYYRGKPCCNKTPIHLVQDHQLEKETSSTAGGGGGGGVGVINSSPTAAGTTAADKESTATSAHATNSTNSSNTAGNSTASKSAYSVVNKNGFQVSMNVKQFAPNELTVKTIDNCIVVEGQHEDKEDGHGVISRHFIRKYMLPKGYDPSEVLSTLSSDGILTVKAPPPALKTDETMERIVDIQQTGGPVQVQQSAAKEPPNAASSGKEIQTSAVTVVAQTVTDAAAGSLPIAVATTLQKQQQQQKQEKQQNKQPEKLSATVEGVQQQPTKLSQATTKDLQITRERNGKLEPNELLAEPETETRTAEQTATSSNTSTNNIANNNNNNSINTNSNNNSGDTNMDCSELKATATSKAISQTEVKETESAVKNAEQTLAAIENVNNKAPHASDATKSSSTLDAIMADATADEPMETEEELESVTKEKVVAQKPIVVSLPTADIKDDAASANNINVNGGVNSAATATTTNNNSTSNDIVTPTNDAVSAAAANGIENNTTNNIDIELAPAAIAKASEIVLITNNGVSDNKTAATGDSLTISLETTVAEVDGVTAMDTDVTVVADVVDGVVDADGLDGGVIAIGIEAIGVGVGVDVNVITAGDSNTTTQNIEDGNEENLSAGNLVVAAQSPTPADLVAAADAAILLAKTQCDGGVGDVAASKPALNTEEITN